VRRLLGMLFLFGALSFVACQQTQEADDDAEGTTVIEKTTVVPPPEDKPDMELDVKMEGEQGEASGEVQVETN
jgi:hypothetical protein